MLNGRRAMTGPNAACVPNGEKFLYDDIVHPNMNGHLLVACMLKSMILLATSTGKSKVNNNSNHKKKRSKESLVRAIQPIHWKSLQFSYPICYSMLKETSGRLHVLDMDGFKVTERPQNGNALRTKRCWEATEAGAFIEVSVMASTELLLVWYQMFDDSMGLAKVEVDGKEVATVNGWFPGYPWAKGSATISVVASGLPNTTHIVRVEVLKEKNISIVQSGQVGKNQAHHFQLISIAVALWQRKSKKLLAPYT